MRRTEIYEESGYGGGGQKEEEGKIQLVEVVGLSEFDFIRLPNVRKLT